LMDNFGGVPLVTSFETAEKNPSRATRQAIYDFVTSELEANVPLLSDKKDASTYARFNQLAGRTLMARVYLNAHVYKGLSAPATADLDKVIANTDIVINSGKFSIESNYFANFATKNEGSAEFILAVPYDEKFAGGFNIHQMTLHYESQKTYNLVDQPWNGYTTMEEFYKSYSDQDARRRAILTGPQFSSSGQRLIDTGAEPSDPDGPPLTFTPAVNELTPNALRQAGGRVGKWEYKLGARNTLDNDFPIYRYAEVLLMKAEALWRKNNADATALALVNQVRARAFDPDQPLTSLGTPSDTYPGPVFLQELGREFFAEGKRRQDLIRFNKYNVAWDFKAASDPSKNIFPIPAPQIVANPNLAQNPGY
jgi:starch-binding outer membrane protein, SusD/RagB family